MLFIQSDLQIKTTLKQVIMKRQKLHTKCSNTKRRHFSQKHKPDNGVLILTKYQVLFFFFMLILIARLSCGWCSFIYAENPSQTAWDTCSYFGIIWLKWEEKLCVISIALVRGTMCLYDVSKWCGVNGEEEGSKGPWGTPMVSWCALDTSPLHASLKVLPVR